MTRRIATHILMVGAIVFTISNIRKHRRTFNRKIKVYYADEPESAPQKGLYINERYQHLKTKECQTLLSPEGRQIFAQRKIEVEPVFGQIKGLFGLQEMESEREAVK